MKEIKWRNKLRLSKKLFYTFEIYILRHCIIILYTMQLRGNKFDRVVIFFNILFLYFLLIIYPFLLHSLFQFPLLIICYEQNYIIPKSQWCKHSFNFTRTVSINNSHVISFNLMNYTLSKINKCIYVPLNCVFA